MTPKSELRLGCLFIGAALFGLVVTMHLGFVPSFASLTAPFIFATGLYFTIKGAMRVAQDED